MANSETLAREILDCDDALMWVVVLNEKGETTSSAASQDYAPAFKIKDETRKRLGFLDAVVLGGYSKGERWYGRLDFITLAFGRAKLVLMHDKGRKAYIVTRVHRSAAAEYVFSRIDSALRKAKAADRRG